MFRSRKPSLKRSQQDDTPRKRARPTPATAKSTPDVKTAPIGNASPVLKASPAITRRASARNLSTKSGTKVQTRIRFPVAKREELRTKVLDLTSPFSTDNPLVEAEEKNEQCEGNTESEALESTARKANLLSVEGGRARFTPLCPVQLIETEVKSATVTSSCTKNVPVFASRKRLDFGAESVVDGCTTVPVDDDDTQSLESPEHSKFWPPYEPSDEVLCSAHEHRLIKAEDDPILDAALELLL